MRWRRARPRSSRSLRSLRSGGTRRRLKRSSSRGAIRSTVSTERACAGRSFLGRLRLPRIEAADRRDDGALELLDYLEPPATLDDLLDRLVLVPGREQKPCRLGTN